VEAHALLGKVGQALGRLESTIGYQAGLPVNIRMS
jgi:hypothetical protein